MGRDDGFLLWSRKNADKRPITERLRDARELSGPRSEAVSKQQAGRCMDCGIPFCHQGCPLGNEIPDFNEAVHRGRWRAAYERLAGTNNFPEFTGRLCPAPCEASCTLAINDDAVTIEQIELEIAERAFAEGWVEPRPPAERTGRTVAVVGSGPAGLAAAAQLNAAGHTVTVFEAADRIGGLLRYGIPDFKLDKDVLDRRLAVLRAEGIGFRTGCRVGSDALPFEALRAEHDAVLLATGATIPRDLSLDGRELEGIHFAMDFLAHHNRRVAGLEAPEPAYACEGRRVVILGGGDTGSDCLGTSLRAGAEQVTQIELMPRPPASRAGNNPWPHWPMIHRVSSSQEEGGEREFAMRTERFVGHGGRVTAIEAVRLQRDGDGRLVPVPDSTVTIPCDLVLLAVGFLGPDPRGLTDQLRVELDGRGNVRTDGYATSVPGVWAAGDARRGQSLIVWAIAEGREAARAIDRSLRGGASPLPTKGRDSAFV